MAHFYRFETKDLTITITGDGNLEGYSSIIVSLHQLMTGASLDLTGDDLDISVENNTIQIHLTQDQTGMFSPGEVKLQVSILYSNGERDVTAEATMEVRDTIYRKVMV